MIGKEWWKGPLVAVTTMGYVVELGPGFTAIPTHPPKHATRAKVTVANTIAERWGVAAFIF